MTTQGITDTHLALARLVDQPLVVDCITRIDSSEAAARTGSMWEMYFRTELASCRAVLADIASLPVGAGHEDDDVAALAKAMAEDALACVAHELEALAASGEWILGGGSEGLDGGTEGVEA